MFWGCIKRKLLSTNLKNKEVLVSYIYDIWEQIPHDQIENAINRVIEGWVSRVIELKWGWFNKSKILI